jgi:hypothetical protein
MANELCIYATPADTVVELALDNGLILTAGTCSANGRDDAHLLKLPKGTTGQGGVLTVGAIGRQSQRVRGILAPSDDGPAMFLFDDFGELATGEAPAPEPEPGPPTPEDAASIVFWVYETQEHDLSTHEGCGQFVEAACQALHDYNSPSWMHDKRTPPQNSYNGHAVDACQCIAGPYYGMYDLIHSSVSPEATPCFNRVGDPNPPNAYYPA